MLILQNSFQHNLNRNRFVHSVQNDNRTPSFFMSRSKQCYRKPVHTFMSTRSNGWVSRSPVRVSSSEYFITRSTVRWTRSNGRVSRLQCNPFGRPAFHPFNGRPLAYVFPCKVTNVSLCQVSSNFLSFNYVFFVLKVKQTQGISLPRYKTIVGFTLTTAFKNILNVLGTYFECEGVECTYFCFTCGDHGNVCSSKKPKFTAKYGLHHTWWLHTWPIRKWKPCVRCARSAVPIF